MAQRSVRRLLAAGLAVGLLGGGAVIGRITGATTHDRRGGQPAPTVAPAVPPDATMGHAASRPPVSAGVTTSAVAAQPPAAHGVVSPSRPSRRGGDTRAPGSTVANRRAPAASPDPPQPPVLAPPEGIGAQQAVADALFQDWKAGDRQAAAQVSTDDVVERLFGMAWDSADTPTGCTQTPASTVICSYAYPDGTLQFYVDGDAGSYRVDVLGTQPY